MSTDLEIEQKMKDWADKNPKWKKYRDNIPLLKHIYAKHNLAVTIKECIVEGRAKITLLILKDMKRKPLLLCSGCHRKSCDMEGCSKEDYVEHFPQAYLARDMTGEKMVIEITPFEEDLNPLKDDTEYVIEGTVSEYKDKKTLRIEKATECQGSETEDQFVEKGVEMAKQIMQLCDDKAPLEKFNNMMKQYNPDQIASIMDKANLIETDGFVVSK